MLISIESINTIKKLSKTELRKNHKWMPVDEVKEIRSLWFQAPSLSDFIDLSRENGFNITSMDAAYMAVYFQRFWNGAKNHSIDLNN